MARPEVIGHAPPGRDEFITFPQLCVRWGNCSHMFPERLLREDPTFPRVYRFGPNGRIRFLKVRDVERYERASVAERT